jgi:CRISPR-associated exonuclease Cas4
MPVLALFLIILALVFYFLSLGQRKQTGLPGGQVVYTDTHAWGKVERPFYDPDLELTGKPDYLVEQNGAYIPVEVKSGRTPAAPYDSHIYQLAAYCLLVHRATGKRPPYGIIHYEKRDFAIDYTPQLEQQLLDLVTEMHSAQYRDQLDRSHEHPARCARCGYRETCDQVIE